MDLGFVEMFLIGSILLVAPILTVFICFKRRFNALTLMKTSFFWCFLLIYLYFLSLFTNIDFAFAPLNIMFMCTLFFACFRLIILFKLIKPKILGFTLYFMSVFSLLFVFLLAVISPLTLILILGDFTEKQEIEARLASGLYCVKTNWGMAGASSGYDVGLYASRSWIPFLRMQVAHASVILTQDDPEVSCKDLTERYQAAHL